MAATRLLMTLLRRVASGPRGTTSTANHHYHHHHHRAKPLAMTTAVRRYTRMPFTRFFPGLRRNDDSDVIEVAGAAPSFLERQMRQFDRELNRMLGEIERSTNFAMPRVHVWQNALDPIEEAADGSRKFILRLDVRQFLPQEVKISITKGVLTVRAEREENRRDGSKMYQEYHRQYTLPSDVDVNFVKSVFTPKGILVVEAPLPKEVIAEDTEIPIQVLMADDKIENNKK